MIVRRERPEDRAAARAVQVAAFGSGAPGEPAEAALLDALRRCGGWLAELSWVAEVDGRVVCTRGHVVSVNGDIACVGLGPIGISPDVQGGGIGSALMHAVIGAADATGEPLIALLGDPAYYSRFGFVPSGEVGIAAPDPAWGAHFQVLPLSAWRDDIGGTFRYAAPFDELD